MDTVNSTSYQNPSRITTQINKYINQMDNFTEERARGFQLKNQDISKKLLLLAIPAKTTKKQMQAIQKSIAYGREKGIEVIVTKVK